METKANSQDFNLSRTALHWIRDSIHYRGFIPTAALFLTRVFEFLRDLTPARRRLRFGDLQFDFDHNVNTTWSNVGLRTRIREIFSGEPYQPIEADQFHEMIRALNIDPAHFTFIDLGSGKGRALLLASEYPFRRIIGVEILPELHAIAQENIRKYTNPTQRCFNLESVCADARDYTLPNEPTLLYLFNPFFEPVLKDVLACIGNSLRAKPRDFLLLYANPLSEHVVASANSFNKVSGTHQYSIFVPVEQNVNL